MTEPLPHDKAIEEIEIVALGAAPPDITAGMLAHADECAECKSELNVFTRMLAGLAILIPDRELNRGRSAGIRSRLLARAGADAEAAAKRQVAAAALQKEARSMTPGRTPAMSFGDQPVRAGPETPARVPALREDPGPQRGAAALGLAGLPLATRVALLWASIATVALLLAATGLIRSSGQRSDAAQVIGEREAEAEARADSLEGVLREREEALDVLAAPGVRIVNLTNWGSRGRPIARVFWDPRTHRWTIFAYLLRPPRAGYVYQVWLVTPDRRISAGTFATGDDGTGRLEATVELDPNALRTISITEERAPGVAQPTGTVMAAGAADRAI